MKSALQSLANSFEPVIRRVNIQPAKGFDPALITIYFRDAKAAKEGYGKLLARIVDDPRTRLDLDASMPTLTYPVI